MLGPAFELAVRKWGRRLRGTAAGVFYFTVGGLFFYWQTNWAEIGETLPSGKISSLQHALSAPAMTGFIVAASGTAIIVGRACSVGKVVGVSALGRLYNAKLLSAEQFELGKTLLLQDGALKLIEDFLSSAARTKPQGVDAKSISALRRYAAEMFRSGV